MRRPIDSPASTQLRACAPIVEDDALDLDGDLHVAGLARAVADEGAQGHFVAHAQEARQGGPHQQRLRDEQLTLALAHLRLGGDGAGASAPGGGVVGQCQLEAGPAFLVCRELLPLRCVLEIRADPRA